VEPGEVVAQAASEDPAVGLRGVASLRALLEAVEELQIRRARVRLKLAADRRAASRSPKRDPCL
jgi:hypothetical protein